MKYETALLIVRSPFVHSDEMKRKAAECVASNILAQEQDMDLAHALLKSLKRS
jgi:hypothetical protein